jgi:hypothetical protein
MYGFLAYVIATFVMVFWYPTPDTAAPAIWPLLWYLGVLMVCGGGYWFWFFMYLIATTVLFGSVPWSKFSHMFFKPAAAFQKRVENANGSRSNLPAPADKPEVFGSARQLPRHY